jgi:hypothetical protein
MGRGQLLFKGDKPKTSKKSSNSSKVKHAPPGTSSSQSMAASSSSVRSPPQHQQLQQQQQQQQPQLPQIQQGKGKITTSGTVVMGFDTVFEKQLAVGDALLVVIPGQDEEEEMRVITMRLSNTSLNLSSAFSKNLTTPTVFRWIPKPRNAIKEKQQAAAQAQLLQHEQDTHAFGGTYASTQELVFREKTETGSYRIKREAIVIGNGGAASSSAAQQQQQPSRGDLLYMRAKKTSDKYC